MIRANVPDLLYSIFQWIEKSIGTVVKPAFPDTLIELEYCRDKNLNYQVFSTKANNSFHGYIVRLLISDESELNRSFLDLVVSLK